MSQPFTVEPRTELLWIAVDLDGTIAESVWPLAGIGSPIPLAIVKLKELRRKGWKIVIHSARGYEAYNEVESWLEHHKIPFDKIVLGKLLARAYLDDRNLLVTDASWIPR